MRKLTLLLFFCLIPVFSYAQERQDPILKIQEQVLLDLKFYKETNTLLLEKIQILEEQDSKYKSSFSLLEEQNKRLLDMYQILLSKENNYNSIIENKDKQILELKKQNEILSKRLDRKGKSGSIKSVLSFVIGIMIGKI